MFTVTAQKSCFEDDLVKIRSAYVTLAYSSFEDDTLE